jgi:hypothetical protein
MTRERLRFGLLAIGIVLILVFLLLRGCTV